MINGKDQEIITINKTGNSILNNAKYSADNTDEWYTTYETIAEELSHYKNQFIDKVVLCNCDDPFESNFCYYFLRHFNQLKLKKLICTSYSGSKIDQLVNGQLTLDISRWATARKKEHKNPPNLKTNSEGNLGYNKITHPNIVFLFGEFVLSNTKQKEPMIRELFHNFIGSAS